LLKQLRDLAIFKKSKVFRHLDKFDLMLAAHASAAKNVAQDQTPIAK
jgi:hypothetical protein